MATLDEAIIVQVGERPPLEFLRAVIEADDIVKVGFGLSSDRGALKSRLGLRLCSAVDMAQLLGVLRYKQKLGAKAAVAIVLKQRLNKSKKVTTSDWGRPQLTRSQLQYAADDCLAALRVFKAMGSPYPPAPVPKKAAQPAPSQ